MKSIVKILPTFVLFGVLLIILTCTNIHNFKMQKPLPRIVRTFQNTIFRYSSIGNTTACIKSRGILLIGLILSAPKNFKSRQRIRQSIKEQLENIYSMKNNPRITFKYHFILGYANSTVKAERNKYGDIIQGDFYDSYRNLPEKSLFMLNWLNIYCNSTDYVLKMDDDIALNVSNLFALTEHLPAGNEWIIGRALINTGPVRDPKYINSIYAPKTIYPREKYPDYMDGLAYVIPLRTALIIFQQQLSVPVFFVEDVYTTGLCRENTNIKIINNNKFCRNHVNSKGNQPFCVAYHP